jgi:hypothetical protein
MTRGLLNDKDELTCKGFETMILNEIKAYEQRKVASSRNPKP